MPPKRQPLTLEQQLEVALKRITELEAEIKTLAEKSNKDGHDVRDWHHREGRLEQQRDELYRETVDLRKRIRELNKQLKQHTSLHDSNDSSQATMLELLSKIESLKIQLDKTTAKAPILPGLLYTTVPGDGNCLYHAIALHLGVDQMQVRAQVADFLEAHREDYEDDVVRQDEQNRTFDQYINDLRNQPEWGGELEINILMMALERQIYVVGPNGRIRNMHLDAIPDDRAIFVFYNGRDHYDAYARTDEYNLQEILDLLRRNAEELAPSVLSSEQEKVLLEDKRMFDKFLRTSFNTAADATKAVIDLLEALNGRHPNLPIGFLKDTILPYIREAFDSGKPGENISELRKKALIATIGLMTAAATMKVATDVMASTAFYKFIQKVAIDIFAAGLNSDARNRAMQQAITRSLSYGGDALYNVFNFVLRAMSVSSSTVLSLSGMHAQHKPKRPRDDDEKNPDNDDTQPPPNKKRKPGPGSK